MMKTVAEVARLCGISVRTLHYYDEIGLLAPAQVTEAGYRLYDGQALARLQQILFFRELDFSLREIQAILDAPSFDSHEALLSQRSLLAMKRDRLEKLIGLVDDILKGERTMGLMEFDNTPIEEARRRYAGEARDRWGGTDAYKESEKRAVSYQAEDWKAINQEMEELFRRLAVRMEQRPDSPEVQALVKDWQDYISKWFYPCTNEILAGLGEMYVRDERFSKSLDRYGDGLARFLSNAIEVACKSEE